MISMLGYYERLGKSRISMGLLDTLYVQGKSRDIISKRLIVYINVQGSINCFNSQRVDVAGALIATHVSTQAKTYMHTYENLN